MAKERIFLEGDRTEAMTKPRLQVTESYCCRKDTEGYRGTSGTRGDGQ